MGTCPSKTQSWLESAALSVRAAWAPLVFLASLIWISYSLGSASWQDSTGSGCELKRMARAQKWAWQFHCNVAVISTIFFYPICEIQPVLILLSFLINPFDVWLAVFYWHYLPGSPSFWERGCTWKPGMQIPPQTKRGAVVSQNGAD